MMSNEVFLERMTSPEVATALDDGNTTVIVPCGAVEQHGPHLPLFVDAEHGTVLGEAVARRLGNALVAPTIRVGCSEHHMDFAGTISLEPSTLEAVCRDYCVSLSRHGFTMICLLPSHGGNFRVFSLMLDRLNDAVGPRCRVVAFTDLLRWLEVWRRAVEDTAGHGDRVGGHADIAESSIVLTLHPELVRPDLAVAGYVGELDGDAIDRIIRDGFKSVTQNGILGDARGMSEAIGAKCIAAVADMVAEYFRHYEGGGRGEEGGAGSRSQPGRGSPSTSR